MKKTLVSLAVAFTLVSVAGCSSNTQEQNTILGGTTGAVVGGLAGSLVGQGTGKAVAIGVGILAGALVGGYAGHSMDSRDNAQMYQTMNNGSTNKTVNWKNKKTGTSYSMVPTSKVMTVNGNPNCRSYNITTTTKEGKTQQDNGIACRQTNGTWQVVKA